MSWLKFTLIHSLWFLNFERECHDNVIDLDFHWIVAYNFANELSRIGLDASSDGVLITSWGNPFYVLISLTIWKLLPQWPEITSLSLYFGLLLQLLWTYQNLEYIFKGTWHNSLNIFILRAKQLQLQSFLKLTWLQDSLIPQSIFWQYLSWNVDFAL